MSHERIRIAIIGAGIGGLALSAALGFLGNESDLEINIYEASSQLTEIGAGINFWPRTWNLMKSIGLEKSLLDILPEAPNDSTRIFFQIRKSDQPQGLYVDDLTMKGGSIRFHRADLQLALLTHLKGYLHLSHRLVDYEEDGEEISLHFQGGKTAKCDFLIAMDGLKSAVRRCFLSKRGLPNSPSLDPICSGDIAYRGLIPIEILQEVFPGHRALTKPMMYVGKWKNIVTYPVAKGKLINLAGFSTDVSKEGTIYDGPTSTSCPREEVLSTFQGWEEEVQALLRCIEKPTKWIIRALIPMDRYSFGRVALGGDAAHAMTPHQGAGAGQAVEDAYILASLISDKLCTRKTVPKVSEIYNTIRCPMANQVLERSLVSGRLCQLVTPGFESVIEGQEVPLENLIAVFQHFSKDLEWVWNESADVDRMRALDMLRRSEGI